MSISRRAVLVATAGVPLLAALPAWAADTEIDVSLWDDPDKQMATGLGYVMGGDMSKANMGIKLSRSEVPAGEVIVNVTNDSKNLVHEMVLSPIAEPGKPLPFDVDMDRVIEDEAGHLGEVAEIDPGQHGGLTLDLSTGSYLLYCNVTGHYPAGMWVVLTVT